MDILDVFILFLFSLFISFHLKFTFGRKDLEAGRWRQELDRQAGRAGRQAGGWVLAVAGVGRQVEPPSSSLPDPLSPHPISPLSSHPISSSLIVIFGWQLAALGRKDLSVSSCHTQKGHFLLPGKLFGLPALFGMLPAWRTGDRDRTGGQEEEENSGRQTGLSPVSSPSLLVSRPHSFSVSPSPGGLINGVAGELACRAQAAACALPCLQQQQPY